MRDVDGLERTLERTVFRTPRARTVFRTPRPPGSPSTHAGPSRWAGPRVADPVRDAPGPTGPER